MKQTFIAYMLDDNGNVIDFYRFSYKRASAVERRIRQAMSEGNTGLMSLYRNDWMKNGVTTCAIYATPDGVSKEKMPEIVFMMDWADREREVAA